MRRKPGRMGNVFLLGHHSALIDWRGGCSCSVETIFTAIAAKGVL